MSHGLGRMQRAILDDMEAARARGDQAVGGPGLYAYQYADSTFVDSQGVAVALPEVHVVHDLRCHLAAVQGQMREDGKWSGHGWSAAWVTVHVPTNTFTAAFTRALYTLIARHHLRAVMRLEPGTIWRTWDGDLPRGRQRFRVEYVAKG
jgi:hypothetical protein